MRLRILHYGNLANDGWSIVKGLRRIGVDADLAFEFPCHVTRCPQLEDAVIDENRIGDYDAPDWSVLNENWSMPDYVHVYRVQRRFIIGKPIPFSRTVSRLFQELKKWRQLGEYDLVIGHAPFAFQADAYRTRYGRSFIIYDAGWIRYLHEPYYAAQIGSRLCEAARRGYRQAAKIIVTNVDTFTLFLKNGYPRSQLSYCQFAIDMERYAPKATNGFTNHSPVFFAPSRHDWPEKGNQYLIEAFARYLKRKPKALLILSDWGQPAGLLDDENYLEKSKSLIRALGIEASVWWISLMSKRKLVDFYNAADIIFDQYIFGALGTSSPEAMSCGKPVVAHVKEALWTRWHTSAPPVADATDESSIYEQMVRLEDEGQRKDLGERGRRWIKENCELSLVAEKQLQIYKEVSL